MASHLYISAIISFNVVEFVIRSEKYFGLVFNLFFVDIAGEKKKEKKNKKKAKNSFVVRYELVSEEEADTFSENNM